MLYIAFVAVFIILHLIILGVSISLVKLSSPADRFSKYYRTLVDLTLPMLFTLGRVRVDVTGEDKIPQDSRFLMVCNHIDNLDPAVLIKAFPRAELAFVAKKEIYTTMPFVARAMHKLHCLPIDRENNREAAKTIIRAAKLISDDVVSIGIFPEGYTSKDGNLQPMRNGAFKIAYKAHVPIVICTVNNTPLILKNIVRHKTIINLDVLDVIYPDEFETLSSNDVGDRVFDIMQKNIEYRRNNK